MDRQDQQLFERYWATILERIPERHRILSPNRVEPELWVKVGRAVESLLTNSPRGMFLLGPVGTGKTALLYLIWREFAFWLARWYGKYKGDSAGDEVTLYHWYRNKVTDVRFYTHGELVDELRDHADHEHSAPCYNPNIILLLDDLGRGFDDKSGWNVSLQDEYFDWRWKNNLPTFVTTNLTSDELRSWAGWRRIVDRLGDQAWMEGYTIGGKSKRKDNPILIQPEEER